MGTRKALGMLRGTCDAAAAAISSRGRVSIHSRNVVVGVAELLLPWVNIRVEDSDEVPADVSELAEAGVPSAGLLVDNYLEQRPLYFWFHHTVRADWRAMMEWLGSLLCSDRNEVSLVVLWWWCGTERRYARQDQPHRHEPVPRRVGCRGVRGGRHGGDHASNAPDVSGQVTSCAREAHCTPYSGRTVRYKRRPPCHRTERQNQQYSAGALITMKDCLTGPAAK